MIRVEGGSLALFGFCLQVTWMPCGYIISGSSGLVGRIFFLGGFHHWAQERLQEGSEIPIWLWLDTA